MPLSVKSLAIASAAFFLLSPAPPAHALELLLPSRPADNLDLTLSAINRAHRSLKVNIYQLSSAPIVSALKAKIAEGLSVQILEEGQPVGGLSAGERASRDDLAHAFAQNSARTSFFREMSSHGSEPRRFRFDHAKYVVADDKAVLIGSENYTDTGNPGEATKGNRGWEAIVNDDAFAEQFIDLFAGDSGKGNGDVLDIKARDLGDALHNLFPSFDVPSLNDSNSEAAPTRAVEVASVTQVVSPTTSLEGLTNLLRSAKQSIDLEQMTFAATWDRGASSSPLLDEVLAAARRGVKVRVLLNDERAFGPPRKNAKPTPNVITNQLLNETAAREGLPLESRIANVARMGVTYIHNKGALVDGRRVLISSINWNQNSVTENREAAVVVDGPAAYGYHEALFQQDWSASAPALGE